MNEEGDLILAMCHLSISEVFWVQMIFGSHKTEADKALLCFRCSH